MDILPLEINRKIFQYLKQKDLQTCYFVCKNWYTITIPLNWEEVSLNRIQIDLVKSHLNYFDHGVYFKYGHLITKLTIKDFEFPSFENRFGFSKLELLELLEQFPNLVEINLSQSGHFKKYLEFLFVAKMQCIKKITGPFNPNSGEDSVYNLLFLVYYRFRESITCMSLLYDKSTVTFHSEKINVLDSLAEFKQLTELVFHNNHDADLTPFQLQKICPNLRVLRYISDYPIPERTILQLPNNISGINLNFMANLTNFDLRLPSLSATYTKYLADYLPDQLKGLKIEILRQGMFNWIDLVGVELASRLMEKAGKLEEVFIYFESNNRLEAPDGDETRPTIFFKLLSVFRKTPQSYCEAIFCGNYNGEDEDNITGYSFRYTPDGKLTVFYDLRDDPNFYLGLPEKNSSVIGPEVFDSLEFYMSGVDYDVVKPILTYSLLNCPRIRSFNLLGNESLDGSFYLQYKHKKNSISSKATQRNINYLEIVCISQVQCHLDLVSAHLFNIESIVLRTEDWDSLDNDSVIDLTGFKNLKTFTNDIITGRSEEYDTDFILVKHMNGEENYYYLDEEKNKNAKAEYSKNPTAPHLTIVYDASVSFNFRRY